MFKIGETPGRDTFGRRKASRLLREARRAAGLSQTEIARRVGVPIQTVNRIEHGVVDPRLGTVEAVLRACGWSLMLEKLPRSERAEEIDELLAVPPLQRLRDVHRPAWAGRAVRTLVILASRGVLFTVDGPTAERLHGAPVRVPDLQIRTLAGAGNATRLRRALEIANRRLMRVAVTTSSCSAEQFAELLETAWWLLLPSGRLAPVVSLEALITAAAQEPERRELLRCVRDRKDARWL